MTRFFMAFAVALLFVSCGKKYDIEYISDRATEVRKVYKPMRAELDSLTLFISQNAEIQKDLAVQLDTVASDSLDITNMVGRFLEGHIPFEDKDVQFPDFIFVNNAFNFSISRPDSPDYNVCEFAGNTQYDMFSLSQPYIWQMHRGIEVMADSLDKYGMDRVAKQLSEEKQLFTKAKYVATLTDMLVILPKLITDESFEEGMLVSILRVYDRKTAKKIGQCVITSLNSESVSILTVSGKEMKEQMLTKDLTDNCLKEVAMFLNLYSPKDKDKETDNKDE